MISNPVFSVFSAAPCCPYIQSWIINRDEILLLFLRLAGRQGLRSERKCQNKIIHDKVGKTDKNQYHSQPHKLLREQCPGWRIIHQHHGYWSELTALHNNQHKNLPTIPDDCKNWLDKKLIELNFSVHRNYRGGAGDQVWSDGERGCEDHSILQPPDQLHWCDQELLRQNSWHPRAPIQGQRSSLPVSVFGAFHTQTCLQVIW